MNIINSRTDLDALAASDPAAHAAFLASLKGSLTKMADIQEYPADYNRNLKPGDDGYLEPLPTEVEDDSVAARFGFTRAELLSL